jgi:1,4-dihydroxy-2-naphthoate octaprenyltransferase
MTTTTQWISGARPRTLPAAVVPVMIGAAVVVSDWRNAVSTSSEVSIVVHGLLALAVSLSLQVAVNYANDYLDGVKGTDANRRGPTRLVASGLATPSAVKRAAYISFGVAGVAGLVLALRVSLWLVPIGLVCMIAGWTYTGGPRPYGYLGLGEVFVFVFFGLVATAGTTYVMSGQFGALALISGSVAGFLAVALLMVNNIRDIPTDRESKKNTLAVRVGDRRARQLYVTCYGFVAVSIVLAAIQRPFVLVGLVGLLAALPAISTVRSATETPMLVTALGMTARVQVVVGTLYAVGLAIS